MIDILKPGRYINREWNAIHKEWQDDMLKVALCFPDIYEIGMSHLGMKILYGILNQAKGVVCERIFAPWSDMEKRMRAKKEILFSLENRKELKDFDVVGFSLQCEMNYTDVLNMLDLGNVPVLAVERGDKDPLVIAGGPCSFNPEPMSLFIDAFVIGEAEEMLPEIVRALKEARPKHQGSRYIALKKFSEIEGIYVPFFNNGHGTPSIKKRIVKDFEKSYFPVTPIVPYIQIVHDRIGIEIMRGCPHGCRFCQACKIFQPLRIRSVKRILEIAEESIKSTGYEEISLLSLSTGDYPYLEELVGKLEERFRGKGIKISLPSLRVRTFTSGETGGIVKRQGLTLAPETGSDRLRGTLNKKIKNEEIIQKTRLLLKSGWRKIKMYFMIGLPGETYEDLDAIVKLTSHIKNVTLSISSFMPRPHSELEREGMDGLGSLEQKKRYLRRRFGRQGAGKGFGMSFHDLQMSRVEAILARGDRKIGAIIYRAWRKGARLQAWREYFDYNLWNECFVEEGLDPGSYLKGIDKGFSLPWSFITS